MRIAIIPGDGIGPEVITQAKKVINAISKKYNANFSFEEVKLGGSAIDEFGTPLPQKTIDVCLSSDAVLLGAIGGPKWDKLPGNQRPEIGLLGLRKAMNVFANLRPAVVFPQLKNASTLKPEVLGDGLDIMVVRELTGGAYFGEKGRKGAGENETAWDLMIYSKSEIRRVAKVGFETAMKRNKKLTLVDKANVLESSRLWRETVTAMASDYPDVELSFMYVDNAAMQLIRNPRQFDTIVTENLFGDILSDEASMLTGSLGMLPSASLGEGTCGLYEPIHGSAPDIAGQDKANPLATILSVGMMLRYSFGMITEADSIERAVNIVLDKGYRTGDIGNTETDRIIGCEEMGSLVAEEI